MASLDRDTCMSLLTSAVVGRVVHTDRALPACTLVNYRLVDHAIVLRTSPLSRLAAATDGAVVAFAVDEIDADSHGGWSVVATGVATAVRDERELRRLEHLGLDTWADGERSHWVRITIDDLSGRRLLPSTAAAADRGARGEVPRPAVEISRAAPPTPGARLRPAVRATPATGLPSDVEEGTCDAGPRL